MQWDRHCLHVSSRRSIYEINVDHAPTQNEGGLALVLIDPLPSNVSVDIPTGADAGNNLYPN